MNAHAQNLNPCFAFSGLGHTGSAGAPARKDQTIIISEGKIQALGDASATPVPAGAKVMEMRDYTVIPGLVGMHDHIFYPAGPGHYNTLAFSAPRLYLACGVTTIRTTGSMEPFTELNLKKAINLGRIPGPKMHGTSPYLEGSGAFTIQMRELAVPEDARKMVQYWTDQGIDDCKVYINITKDELAAAIDEVHKRGMKVSGYLCSIGFRETAALGIDNLEHGLLVDSETSAKSSYSSRQVSLRLRPLRSRLTTARSIWASWIGSAPWRPASRRTWC